MRLGAWSLAGLGLLLLGCSGGYPLPPTRCDEWCSATKGLTCEADYAPANCVSECEQTNTDDEACHTQFDAVVSCFRNNPRASQQLCVYDGQPNVCEQPMSTLFACTVPAFGG